MGESAEGRGEGKEGREKGIAKEERKGREFDISSLEGKLKVA